QLRRQHRVVVGRLDSRFEGPVFDPLAKEADEDPQSNPIIAAVPAALLDWYHDGLKFGEGKNYVVIGELYRDWDWKHKAPGAPFPLPTLPNTNVDLAHAMVFNPDLRVLVLNGTYDLATPFYAT